MATVDEVFEQAMGLSPVDRQILANRIIESTVPNPPGEDISPEEWEQVWAQEIQRRSDDLHSGAAKGIPWEEAIAELLAKYKPRGAP